MTNEQQRGQATSYLTGKFPTVQHLLNATNSATLMELLANKARLYLQPCPTIDDLNGIYKSNAAETLLQRIFTYVFVLKENTPPMDNVKTALASNFRIVCNGKTVNQLLCFVAEYPSMRQFGKGFDYTHFADSFSTYCQKWQDGINEQLGLQEEQRKKSETAAEGPTGVDGLRLYFQKLKSQGVDFRQSVFCKASKIKQPASRKKSKQALEDFDLGISATANAIADELERDGYKPNSQATYDYYERPRLEREEQIKRNRKRLARKFLTPEEVTAFFEEDNKAF